MAGKIKLLALVLTIYLIWFGGGAYAQSIAIDLGQGSGVSEQVILLVGLITILTLAPSLLIAVTCFTRIIIVLSLLRTAIGLQTSPPNTVLIGLALFLSAFIMAPTFNSSYTQGIEPLIAKRIDPKQALSLAAKPFHRFMLVQVREEDLALFSDLVNKPPDGPPEQVSYSILLPAFMISELRRAFEIGFLLFLPFVIIDLVVASLLMSMGMMMLPPIIVSLPFKLIFFVIADGWHLVAGSLIESFG